jgi:hypothetical protein
VIKFIKLTSFLAINMNPIVIRPEPGLLEATLAVDPRVHYVPSREIIEYDDGKGGVIRATPERYAGNLLATAARDPVMAREIHNFRSFVYNDFVFDDLGARIRDDHQGQLPVGIRGVALSLGGGIQANECAYIRSLAEVLEHGSEMPGDDINIAGFNGKNVMGMMLHYRVTQYLLSSSKELRELLGSEREKGIFPGILVFDLSMVRDGGSGLYAVSLPSSPEDKKRVLLGVYIVDYILDPQEWRESNPTQKSESR